MLPILIEAMVFVVGQCNFGCPNSHNVEVELNGVEVRFGVSDCQADVLRLALGDRVRDRFFRGFES